MSLILTTGFCISPLERLKLPITSFLPARPVWIVCSSFRSPLASVSQPLPGSSTECLVACSIQLYVLFSLIPPAPY